MSCTINLYNFTKAMFDTQISYSALRADLASYLEKAAQDNKIILVTRQNAANAVVLSEREYTSLVETVHLMRSPTNARRLSQALEWSEKDQGEFQSIEELRKEVERESQAAEPEKRAC